MFGLNNETDKGLRKDIEKQQWVFLLSAGEASTRNSASELITKITRQTIVCTWVWFGHNHFDRHVKQARVDPIVGAIELHYKVQLRRTVNCCYGTRLLSISRRVFLMTYAPIWQFRHEQIWLHIGESLETHPNGRMSAGLRRKDAKRAIWQRDCLTVG